MQKKRPARLFLNDPTFTQYCLWAAREKGAPRSVRIVAEVVQGDSKWPRRIRSREYLEMYVQRNASFMPTRTLTLAYTYFEAAMKDGVKVPTALKESSSPVKLSPKVNRRLNEFAQGSGLSREKIVELAINDYAKG